MVGQHEITAEVERVEREGPACPPRRPLRRCVRCARAHGPHAKAAAISDRRTRGRQESRHRLTPQSRTSSGLSPARSPTIRSRTATSPPRSHPAGTRVAAERASGAGRPGRKTDVSPAARRAPSIFAIRIMSPATFISCISTIPTPSTSAATSLTGAAPRFSRTKYRRARTLRLSPHGSTRRGQRGPPAARRLTVGHAQDDEQNRDRTNRQYSLHIRSSVRQGCPSTQGSLRAPRAMSRGEALPHDSQAPPLPLDPASRLSPLAPRLSPLAYSLFPFPIP